MKFRTWRVVKGKYGGEAFSGEGALKFGGRWNSRGTPLVYTSESLSLATLEILAGGISMPLLSKYVKIPVDFDASLIESFSVGSLPKEWTNYPPSIKTQKIGDNWVKESRSVVLKVPSVVIKEEFNYLINPFHSDFNKIFIGKPEAFSFDKRLLSDPQKTFLQKPA
jgi:RES domain-containing protein